MIVFARSISDELACECAFPEYASKQLDELACECAVLLQTQDYEEADIKRIHNLRKKLTKFIFIKGLGVAKR